MRTALCKLAVFALTAHGLQAAAGESSKSLQSTNTQHLDFPSGGTLRLDKSIGELKLEAWDQPGVEITTVKWVKIKGDKPPKATAKDLDKINVKADRKDNEIVVSTSFPKHNVILQPFTGLSDFELEYRIKAPKDAKLAIDHQIGEIHIAGFAGDIHATNGMGQITVAVVPGTQYAIDARSKLGAIDSDTEGKEKKRLKFGHTFVSQSQNAKKLYLRIGSGDITILDTPTPVQK
jgi:hypothetical protein